MLIARALYDLNSSGTVWRLKLTDILMDMGYAPSESNRDALMKQCQNANRTYYYKYRLYYVDNIFT